MKIAVLVSGGVDSSVALKLLKDQGHDVTAFYLKIWLEDELSYLGTCPWQEDLNYVQKVCKSLDVPLEIVSLQREYHDLVVKYAINEIKVGRTPNPDIMCNQRIKFGLFLDAIGPEYEKIASGHYAQLEEKDGLYYLKQAPDAIKDQTYFLSHLSQAQLSRLMFPIGHLSKPEVRAYAQSFDLPNKDRKDSQGICFLGKLKFRDFVKHYLGTKPGDMIEYETGEVVNTHDGYWFYTIGQRSGLGLSGGPWYVVKKDIDANIIYISCHYYSSEKKRDTFRATFINDLDINDGQSIRVKLRHGPKMYDCTVEREDSHARVHLKEDDQGIAPGQFAVFYRDGYCIGSGVIE